MKNIEHLIGKRVFGVDHNGNKIHGKLVVSNGEYQILKVLNVLEALNFGVWEYGDEIINVYDCSVNLHLDYDKDYTTSKALELVNRAWCKAANIKFVDLSDADYRLFIETNF